VEVKAAKSMRAKAFFKEDLRRKRRNFLSDERRTAQMKNIGDCSYAYRGAQSKATTVEWQKKKRGSRSCRAMCKSHGLEVEACSQLNLPWGINEVAVRRSW
jgi:hypothetical protein